MDAVVSLYAILSVPRFNLYFCYLFRLGLGDGAGGV